MMRLGLLGGTFDPIHLGHLDVAAAAAEALGLERIVMLPSRLPPHRGEPQASAAHRFAMVALAVQSLQNVLVSDLEVAADGPSYTASTLDRLAARGMDTRELVFVTGADAFRDIRAWREYPALLDRCHFAVVSRPGFAATRLPDELPELRPRMHETPCAIPAEPGIFLVDAVTSPVSSTEVRRRIAAGAPIDGLVLAAVAGHIAKHGLYAPDPPKGLA